LILLLLGVFAIALAAWAAIPQWMHGIDSGSALERVLFRRVPMPGGEITIRRPPAEAVPALGEMIKSSPRPEELYSLRAMEEEQALDFTAAEADWKLYLQTSPAKAEAQLALADFYHRRHRSLDEVNALSALGRMPPVAAEKFTALTDQQSWRAFERIFKVIQAQALGKTVALEQYRAWIERYPKEQSLYSRYFEFLLDRKDFKAARELIASYQGIFPKDEVFLTKAQALLAYRQGAVEQGLAVYERNYQPLWPDELLKNYFNLLGETDKRQRFLQQAKKALERNPDDLNAASRIFHYYQQQGNLNPAEQSLTKYRQKKESRSASWSAEELYTFAQLLERSQRYQEAASYYFALYNSPDQKGGERALVGLANILLEAPEQQIRFGAPDISMYSSIATMDTGPGYLNGILSLILNDTAPAYEYAKEEKRAVAYFHRARAAELIALLDKKFPRSEARARLHARLIDAYSDYGKDEAVIRLGSEFLQSFPRAEQRTRIALLMADIYEANGKTKAEYEIFDSLLKELAQKADGVPLGEDIAGAADFATELTPDEYHDVAANADDDRWAPQPEDDSDEARPQKKAEKQAFSLSKQTSDRKVGARSPEYAQVLNKYLSRLAQQHAVPEALVVLRRELDRNPDDPGLYERFAQFLEQNALGSEEEAVYKRAIQKFSGTSWYEKLARWYLRHDRQNDFESLTNQVTKIFSGTELQAYVEQVRIPSALSVAVEEYAHRRFPHNLTFVNDLLCHYQAHGSMHEWETLLRQYWYEDESLRNMFFEYLSRTGRLEDELRAIKHENAGESGWPAVAKANPAAVRFEAEAELWRSHFEQAAPALRAVANLYPADNAVGREASSVYRSLAYFRPRNTAIAAGIELNLLRANPSNRDTLARIGDIYADHSQFVRAAPYWNRMPATEPGNPASYEEAATVFWDYYMFDDALRLLEKGRTRLSNNTLYSYQAGAIYENKRDYSHAVAEYVKGALETGAESPSYTRLVQLSGRRSTAAQVDATTAKAVAESGFTIEAIRLRADVLRAESRTEELASLLDSLVKRVDSAETLEQMDVLAMERGLSDVHCQILEREAAISNDPVRKMQLRYALANFYESRKNLTLAEQNIDSLYKENPRILGVVRATVDFYWRNKQPKRAIAVLEKAAADAYPELRNNLNFEAARKMTESGEYEAARRILASLLERSAYNGEYLVALAETYARAGDNAGLRDLYVKELALFRQASLPAAERKTRIAALRRGLIPSLTAIKDYAGAVDQYIELINSYPDDESISSEAAVYAQRHGRTAQIINFYKKTVVNSPQDPRWVIVLARLQAVSEDHEGALQSYSQAISIRPDRVDLLTARANLEERLLRFDEAAADYTTLYERTYHDPRWMEREAEVRAGQNKPELAARALEAAFVENHPKSASAYFSVAERLEQWNFLTHARAEAEMGIQAARTDLLAGWENHSGARTYVRIMTRLRLQDQAFQRLESAINDANVLPLWSREAAKKGIDAVTDKEWREGILSQRTYAASSGMVACMEEMGATVQQYFTPEEKKEFLQLAKRKNSEMSRTDAHDYLIPLAQRAELTDFEAQLRYEALKELPSAFGKRNQYTHFGSLEGFVDLQTRRLRLGDLGDQLERLAKNSGENACWNNSTRCLQRAADTYHLANMPEDELRVLTNVYRWSDLGREQQQRYFELLLAQSPQTLLEWSTHNYDQGNQSVEFILTNGGRNMAEQAIRARGGSEPPVWRSAYVALAGLYLGDSSPQINAAFQKALADQTIGQRLKTVGDRSEALSGEAWFYYGARYGEYLEMAGRSGAEDFLPSELENTPANVDAYSNTAAIFEQYGDLAHAIEDYQHVLELSPDRVDAHYRLAGIYWKQNRRDDAERELRQALAALKKRAHFDSRVRNVPADFNDDYVAIAELTRKMGAWPQLNAELIGILNEYVKSDGYSHLQHMIAATLMNPRDKRAATNLVLELSHSSTMGSYFLEHFVNQNSELKVEAEPILRRLVEVLREETRKEKDSDEDYVRSRLEQWELKWMESLLAGRQYDRLWEELRIVTKRSSQTNSDALLSMELRLAAATGKIDSVLSTYRADSAQAPSNETLRSVAKKMEDAGDKQSARKVLEFVYQREIDEHQMTVANMLGLAEIRLENGDPAAGLELLRRMTLVAGAPFEAQGPAAELLMRSGHANEAIPFLQELVTAMPWKAEYRVRLDQAKLSVKRDQEDARKELIAVAQDKKIAYQVRVAAAKSLAGMKKSDLGSEELNLLASGGVLTPAQANQQFFFAARLSAAEHSDNAARIELLRAALEDYPTNDMPRLPLMRAAMKSGDYHLAIAVVKRFLHSHWLDLNSSSNDYYGQDDVYDSDEDSDSVTSAEDFAASDEFATELEKLPAAEKAEVCEQAGRAFEKLGALSEALSSYYEAESLHPAPATAKSVRSEMRRVRQIMQERRLDRERRPTIHDDLEQQSVVRPRLKSMKPEVKAVELEGGNQ